MNAILERLHGAFSDLPDLKLLFNHFRESAWQILEDKNRTTLILVGIVSVLTGSFIAGLIKPTKVHNTPVSPIQQPRSLPAKVASVLGLPQKSDEPDDGIPKNTGRPRDVPTNVSRFKHQRLTSPGDEIRLIRLWPSEDDERSSNKILSYLRSPKSKYGLPFYTIEKHSTKALPPFDALSYTWRSYSTQTTTQSWIILNDGTQDSFCPISTNLHEFLEEYRRHWWLISMRKSVYLWIDQLCIDQHNVNERNLQLQLMGKIYSRASVVYVWLGPLNGDLRIACDLIESVARRAGKWSSFFRSEDKLFQRSSRRKSIELFFHLPYWKRVWIVQEFLLARQIRLVCGKREIYNFQLERFWSARMMKAFGTDMPMVPENFLILMQRFSGTRDFPLCELLMATFRNGCKEPKDKVFGIQALVEPWDRVEVDYNKSVKEVYLEAVEKMLKRRIPLYSTVWTRRYAGNLGQFLIDLSKEMGVDLERDRPLRLALWKFINVSPWSISQFSALQKLD